MQEQYWPGPEYQDPEQYWPDVPTGSPLIDVALSIVETVKSFWKSYGTAFTFPESSIVTWGGKVYIGGEPWIEAGEPTETKALKNRRKMPVVKRGSGPPKEPFKNRGMR